MRTIKQYSHWIIYIALVWFCWLMFEITWQYKNGGSDIAFLRIKQDVVDIPIYLPSFYAHVATSMIALLAGFTQFSNTFRRKYPLWHRRIGYSYIIVIVFISGPAGLIMGYYANGGIPSQIAFCMLAVLWIFTTTQAWRTAMRGQYDLHRVWMIRSYALTLSAITLRLWKFGIVQVFEPRPMDVYRIVAWLGWVLNALVAEWIIWKTKSLSARLHTVRHEES